MSYLLEFYFIFIQDAILFVKQNSTVDDLRHMEMLRASPTLKNPEPEFYVTIDSLELASLPMQLGGLRLSGKGRGRNLGDLNPPAFGGWMEEI